MTPHQECEIIRLGYTWTVRYFYINQPSEEKSDTFPSETVRWRLIIEKNGDAYSIFLRLEESERVKRAVANYRFSLLNEKGEPVYAQRGEYEFETGNSHGIVDFFTSASLRELGLIDRDKFPHYELIIYCEIDYLENSSNVEIPARNLADDLYYSFIHSEFSDVTIRVNGLDIKAHKAILAARSPVFRRMFLNKMKEVSSNLVEITDFEPNVIKEMVKYIYTDRSSIELQNNVKQQDREHQHLAIELLRVADKYQLDRLKAICQQAIYKSLSIDCVVDILLLADQYNAAQLKRQAIEFISLCSMIVVNTDAWYHLVKEKSDLAIEVMKRLCCNISGPKSGRLQFVGSCDSK